MQDVIFIAVGPL